MQDSPDARAEKEAALALVAGHLTHPDKKVRDRFKKAHKHIRKSLDKGWIDAMHLDPKDGKKVFDEEQKAAKELARLLDEKHPAPPAVVEDVAVALHHLITADQVLATVAMEEAAAACAEASDDKDRDKCEQELEKAQKEYDKAEDELAKEKYDKAIDHYKKAWGKAQKAVKQVKKMFLLK